MNIHDLKIKMEDLHPRGEYMVVQPLKGESQTKSGIVLPNAGSSGATPTIATVIRAGDLARYEVGTVVMFRRYSVDEIEFVDSEGSKKVSIIENDDVLCEIKQE